MLRKERAVRGASRGLDMQRARPGTYARLMGVRIGVADNAGDGSLVFGEAAVSLETRVAELIEECRTGRCAVREQLLERQYSDAAFMVQVPWRASRYDVRVEPAGLDEELRRRSLRLLARHSRVDPDAEGRRRTNAMMAHTVEAAGLAREGGSYSRTRLGVVQSEWGLTDSDRLTLVGELHPAPKGQWYDYVLRAPVDKSRPFVLTTLTPQQLASHYRAQGVWELAQGISFVGLGAFVVGGFLWPRFRGGRATDRD